MQTLLQGLYIKLTPKVGFYMNRKVSFVKACTEGNLSNYVDNEMVNLFSSHSGCLRPLQFKVGTGNQIGSRSSHILHLLQKFILSSFKYLHMFFHIYILPDHIWWFILMSHRFTLSILFLRISEMVSFFFPGFWIIWQISWFWHIWQISQDFTLTLSPRAINQSQGRW